MSQGEAIEIVLGNLFLVIQPSWIPVLGGAIRIQEFPDTTIIDWTMQTLSNVLSHLKTGVQKPLKNFGAECLIANARH